ncbi:MAG: fused MFS/spermidine synthase, partial [Longimicrobiales bacterium]
MAQRSDDAPERAGSSPRLLPLLVLLFIGSGAAALVYEIVWFQMLSLIIGSSSVSLGVLLATFMGGMAAGSLGLSRFVSTRPHPLRVYALLEAGIGVLGLVVLVALPYAGGLYLAIGGPGVAGLLLRAGLCALCLLPPTVLMGATLPAIARWVESTPRGVSWLGFFYGGNIAGAVVGSLLAGFYLLRVYDVVIATLVAAAINVAVAAVGFALARTTSYNGRSPVSTREPERQVSTPAVTATPESRPRRAPTRNSELGTRNSPWPVLAAITISGMTALAAEVVWTRLLTLTLGGTVYTFSLILAAFLAGLGMGSGAGAALARSVRDPRTALGVCQLMLTAGIAWAAFWLTRALPYWPIDPWLSTGPAFTFQIDFVRCLVTVLPPAMFWGASFPLALAAVAQRGEDPGRLVGRVYAANTAGAIAGALLASLIIVAWAGTQLAQRIL